MHVRRARYKSAGEAQDKWIAEPTGQLATRIQDANQSRWRLARSGVLAVFVPSPDPEPVTEIS
jgi:hypothetical protein